jgi:hypothetical protein
MVSKFLRWYLDNYDIVIAGNTNKTGEYDKFIYKSIGLS